eukprot:CAMPEP_0181203770 /NCGR_PEP_ID=MMETSP1096-20121128/19571_1 /TAXON_ID=156174 ORGANISM="Chrysochromulina ericina, Strain CCMP281" /NCGR_SAMPLE_ID=MMETSP1096 /ASSEMBLY_ACC=CAM_ASM_000453 /LENGTH=70 /DNA_ID=CAMNT_0023294409 /DNA_START=809 /DNA_END=1021 /DNA_ORIENTATION=+
MRPSPMARNGVGRRTSWSRLSDCPVPVTKQMSDKAIAGRRHQGVRTKPERIVTNHTSAMPAPNATQAAVA